MKYDVVALGELLIDFTQNGFSEQGNPLFEANPGGAPCNVLAMLAARGKKTAFIGKVGDDMFGRMLKTTIEEVGIDSAGLVMDKSRNTTLAFVQTAPDGDRDFSFFRKPGADTGLEVSELEESLLQNCAIFHFGSLSLTHQPAREATRQAVARAKAAGARISFDPNLRPLLWENLDAAKEQMAWGCAQCDILKIAEEELTFLTGCESIRDGVAALRERYPDIAILFVTRGKQGSECFFGQLHVECPTFLNHKAVDTTGAGDTFCGCMLASLLERPLDTLDETALFEMLRYANAAATLVTTKKGAIRAMPGAEAVQAVLAE